MGVQGAKSRLSGFGVSPNSPIPQNVLRLCTKQGRWTYKEYALVDDGKRYEVMNGVLLAVPSASILHQEVLGELSLFLGIEKTVMRGKRDHPIDKSLLVLIRL